MYSNIIFFCILPCLLNLRFAKYDERIITITLKKKFDNCLIIFYVIGVQLIDRNDELCILYERSNQQQQAFKKGMFMVIADLNDTYFCFVNNDYFLKYDTIFLSKCQVKTGHYNKCFKLFYDYSGVHAFIFVFLSF